MSRSFVVSRTACGIDVNRWGLVLLVFCCAVRIADAKYGGGSGTAEQPYLICTAEQMNTIGLNKEDWDKHFKLMADIDLSAYQGDSFHLIGIDHPRRWQEIAPFAGIFDGNGHTIANFTYAVSKGEPERTIAPWAIRKIGLFRYVSGPSAEVKNLGLVDPNVCLASGFEGPMSVVGALIGELYRGRVTNCYVEGGFVSGDSFVGGLVGISYQGTLSFCHTRCRVACSQMEKERLSDGSDGPVLFGSFGGLLGDSPGSTVSQCWTAGTIRGHYLTGGLVGAMISYSPSGRQEELTRAIIVSCQSVAGVNGAEYVGGLVGRMAGQSEISGSSAAGTVSGRASVGGLAGYMREEARLRTSCARGNVSGNDYVGGLVGLKESKTPLSDCYAVGNVSGHDYVGGLAGRVPPTASSIKNSYATGRVTGARHVGGLVGETGWNLVDPGPYIVDSFWDTQTTGQLDSSGSDRGYTTAEMQSIWTYVLAGWDFVGETWNGTEDIWKACCGRPMYPKLAWEPTRAGDFVDPEGIDSRDLKALADNWLATANPPCQSGDLTLDTRVDFRDFAVLARWWRQGARKTIYETTLETAPDWQANGQWQFGRPAGRGGSEHGHPDPISGYTGPNVYGVNLNGDYRIAVDGPHYLTAGPFDCSRYHGVKLQFARWLNTDQADFVDATVEVSNDGGSWATVWAYSDTEAELTEDAWTVAVYDIGDMADYQRQVYIRWGYEVFDEEAWAFSGWNIDDISLFGYESP
jgi:hypothetical protein